MFGLDQVVVRIAGFFIAIAIAFAFGYYKGRHSVQLKFDAYKAEVKSAADTQVKLVKETQAKQDQITKDTQNAYKTKFAVLRTYYGMQHSNGSGSMLKVPNTATGANGYPTYTILVGQCAQTTLQLNSLQDWVTTQQSVMK